MNDEILFATEDQLADLAPAEEAIDSQKFLIFLCDGLRLGVVAEWVVEILTNLPITYLPMMPDYIPGIINMRGQIIPIVDVRLRLGKMPAADHRAQHRGHATGYPGGRGRPDDRHSQRKYPAHARSQPAVVGFGHVLPARRLRHDDGVRLRPADAP